MAVSNTQNRTTSTARGLIPLVWLLVAIQSWGLLHTLVEQHTVCLEHGELVDSHGESGAAVIADATTPSHALANSSRTNESKHQHCPVGYHSPAPSPLHFMVAWSGILSFILPAPPIAPAQDKVLAILAYAQKTSPPAA